jgi:ATP-dependent Clp protease protease subunit
MQTFVIGQAASAAAVLLGAGAPGKRFALPNAGSSSTSRPSPRALRPGLRHRDPGQRGPADARPGWRTPGQALRPHVEQVRKDIERDKILSAEEAKEYGLIDEVLARARHRLIATEPTGSDPWQHRMPSAHRSGRIRFHVAGASDTGMRALR